MNIHLDCVFSTTWASGIPSQLCCAPSRQVNQSKGEAGMLETRKAYEYALDRIGLDLHAAGLWHEYINYLQLPRPNTPAFRALWTSTAAPGQEDSQRVMTLRLSCCAVQSVVESSCIAARFTMTVYVGYPEKQLLLLLLSHAVHCHTDCLPVLPSTCTTTC